MTHLENDLLLRACRREPTPRRPVWIMRQAGRYLASYQEVRKEVDFFTLCRTPELVAKVSLQPVNQIGVDAAIIFSDILVIPQAMGMHVDMEPGTGPVFEKPLRSAADLAELRRADPADLHYVPDALRETKKALAGRVPLIGFAGAPWTLFTYMVEGQGSKEFPHAKGLMYREPEVAHRVLSMLADGVADYLVSQVEAGADVVQLFDTWAGLLRPADFREFALPYVQRIIERLPQDRAPVIYFPKGVHHSQRELAASGADVISLEWTVDLADARSALGDRVALQGNLDPVLLYADPDRIAQETEAMMRSYGSGPGLIANLGHGIRPDTSPDHARAFVDAVKAHQL
jgi:uroporphyrinogen decarboxylase